jgi:LysR family transcriptional regulator, transcriptional activator of nhaA
MEWLNYHHLLYFYTVAKEGSIARAAETLRLAQPTISGQLRVLEEALGERLFERRGRALVMTEVGSLVYRYADEIFALGRELQETLKGRPAAGRPARLRVGIADVVPKLIGHRLLAPALDLPDRVQLHCREDRVEVLMAELARHAVDLVITEAPSGPELSVRVFNHLLGETTVSVFAAPALAARHRAGFPGSLDGAPFLMPAANTVVRRTLDQFFAGRSLRPVVVAEFEDSALLNVFGQSGRGLFVEATAIEREVCQMYGVEIVGRLEEVRERFYAVSVERRIKNPAVRLITETARKDLFVTE